jgi:hypothetical protein
VEAWITFLGLHTALFDLSVAIAGAVAPVAKR